jgi:hypothetical protein
MQKLLGQLRANLFQLDPDQLKLMLKEAVPEYEPHLTPPKLGVTPGLQPQRRPEKAKLSL